MSKYKQCTLSTTSEVVQPCVALLDRVPFQKNLQCCARTVSSRNHHLSSAMRSQKKVRISTMGVILSLSGKETDSNTAYLTRYICDRAGRDFPHLDDLRYMCLNFYARRIPFCTSVIFNDIRAIAITGNVLCGGGGCEDGFEGLPKMRSFLKH